ncbi:hypothetical protein HK100_002209 [Physocladia obscura]|uniref:Protein kinase domain-containing protein n=1 Tax=Physocladia obscura TaxID=109957 RepID=A0AAD5XB95_9FUNG|nr:hypothetical protein HK100_002209 [Physocladia obscura]
MFQHGFFHRDLKPENLLMTQNTVKIADFGLARETRSLPPYTEYVSTRWYRAPEVLLKNPNYSSPIDMWAMGTIIAELFLMNPIFPGTSEIDQLHKICAVLGSPANYASVSGNCSMVEPGIAFGLAGGMVGSNAASRVTTPLSQSRETFSSTASQPLSENSRPRTSQSSPIMTKPLLQLPGQQQRDRLTGGGPWIEGIKLAGAMGFKFPNATPVMLSEIIPNASAEALVLIGDLLLFDPHRRISAYEAIQNTWFKNLNDSNQTAQRSFIAPKYTESKFDNPKVVQSVPVIPKPIVEYGKLSKFATSSDSFDFLSDDRSTADNDDDDVSLDKLFQHNCNSIHAKMTSRQSDLGLGIKKKIEVEQYSVKGSSLSQDQFILPKHRVCPVPVVPSIRPQTNASTSRYSFERDTTNDVRPTVSLRLKSSLSNSDLFLGAMQMPSQFEGFGQGLDISSTGTDLRKQYRPLPKIGKTNVIRNNGHSGGSKSSTESIGTGLVDELQLDKKRTLPSVLRRI